MKNQINEGFIDKLFGMIAKGRVDKATKDLMKNDKEFAKAVKDAKDAQKRMADRLAKKYAHIK
tara:strand:+ start:556 stop:744 length:189 start_codon:yes stop_codon:yes gene_type:complete